VNGAFGNAPDGVVWDEWRIWICALWGYGMNGAYAKAAYGGAGCMAYLDMRPMGVGDERCIWICVRQGCGMCGAYGYAPDGFKIKSASSNALDKKLRAGDADPGPLIRRRRREVALVDTIRQCPFLFMTLNLRLTYDFERFFYPN
jgi:hypothetical protein